jgi:hypothetical protein
MAIIDPTFIDPASPPRVRGQFLVQKWRDKYVFRRWPQRGGPRDKRLRDWQRAQFGLAARLCANPWCIDLWTAIEITRGSQMVPRDFLMACCYARAYYVEGPDGVQWPVADHGPPAIVPVETAPVYPTGYLQIDPRATHVNTPGFLKLCPVLLPAGYELKSIQTYANAAAATAKVTPCVYSDVNGTVTALLQDGPAVTGVTQGVNDLPLTNPYVATAVQLVWLGLQHETANITVNVNTWNIRFALASHTGALPNPAPAMTYLTGNDSVFWGMN